ncbi:Lipid-A-disaccharide synthase [Phytophthora cinnamomi]|uniref:Lipid-A-disaccharide synthase n=1 Tax=Phytophthora cinnamomi TaxID=4785 RepID=UPI00355A13CA|nr:Lipid-A-disaccharide synthase [Phytophthora cinnamomi]
MWRSLRRQRCLSVCGLSTAARAPVKLYVVAGEASGDAIGAKVIRALQRHQPPQSLEFRGIGGPQMCRAGGFQSLFPMQELSVMGLVEVVPYLWRFRRRIQDTLRDIEAFQPELVLTIDSKGFTFRVLKALQASERQAGGKRLKKAHYVAPSVWAYKHRGKRDFTELKQLLDAMFVILPFEEDIFRAGEEKEQHWCHFVGHPAVEDFLESHGAYDRFLSYADEMPEEATPHEVEIGADALLDLSKFDASNLLLRGQLFRALASGGRESGSRAQARKEFGIPANAFVICALVGSRANEVKKSARLVLDAIDEFKRTNASMQKEKTYVVFPTIAAVEEQVSAHISVGDCEVKCRVLADLDAVARLRLFQSSDLAVAVSGTITGFCAIRIRPEPAAWEISSAGGSFSDCTQSNIANALSTLHRQPLEQRDELHLAMAVSTLTKWQESSGEPATAGKLRPIRASGLVAEHILNILKK